MSAGAAPVAAGTDAPGAAAHGPNPPARPGTPPLAGAPIGLPTGAAITPFRLPGRHFGAAIVFLVLGAAGLLAVAPELAAGVYLSPRVVAVAHLFTLGWITTSIMGALYQLLPVLLGRPVRSVPLAHGTLAVYVPGLAAFVAGLVWGVPWLMLAGAAAFGAALVLFVGNLGVTLARAPRRDLTWWALASATMFLLITVLLGLALAANLGWGFLGAARLDALGVHVHVALAGWVLLVMIGVANRLLPMFLLSHGAGDRLARAAVALVAGGAAVLAVLHHAPPLVSRWIPAALIASGTLCFLLQAAQFYRHSRRPALDPGMRLAAAALAMLAVALVLAGPAVAAAASLRWVTAYGAALILGISLFVAAHYYKIVPFLVWYHRFGPIAGTRPVPRVAELYSARLAGAAGALLVLGAGGVLAGVLAGWPAGVRAAAVLFLGGAAVEATQMLMLARRTP